MTVARRFPSAPILAAAVAMAALAVPNAACAQGPSSSDTALARQVEGAKISLDRGLSAATARGTPISAKYEIEDGKLQLSVYTAKAGKFWEVIVNHQTGSVGKSEEIKEGDDLTAAKSQDGAMAKAKRSLRTALRHAIQANKGYHAVSVTPGVEGGKPVATIALARGSTVKSVSEPLD